MEDNLKADSTVVEELWVRVVTQELLKFARHVNTGTAVPLVDSEAVRVLSEIKRILDDPSLEDPAYFYRIDAIVDEFYRTGLSTRRHRECE